MNQQHHARRHGHHFAITYPISLRQRLYALVLGPLIIVGVVYLLVQAYPLLAAPSGAPLTVPLLLEATVATVARLAIAYIFAVLCAVPLALLVTMNKTLEEILLPVFDVLQSVPILALFPVIILIFIVKFDSLNGAAIFILFLSMLWNMVFTLVGGLKIIPGDIIAAAEVFGLKGFAFIRQVILPAIVPQLVTGSILAVAQGWNLIIVAEVLHTYIPGGTSAQDIFGIGSILVSASANAQGTVFVEAVFLMVVIIGFFNLFVWQRLLRIAQGFRFE